jgi:hypothetical protein
MTKQHYHALRRSEFQARKALADYGDGMHWNEWTVRRLRYNAETIKAPRNRVCWPEHTFNAQQANRRRRVLERARRRHQTMKPKLGESA